MVDRERVTSGSMRRLPRVKVDVIVLGVLVVSALTLGPGPGLWGWALALVAVVSVGLVVGIVGRRYPWIHGQPPRARRTRRS
jgi:O-antigen/teichoic acid export membrane protein